jgi:hypothetical protein
MPLSLCNLLPFPAFSLLSEVFGLLSESQMYFNFNHMFFAEFAYGYAYEKGAVKKNTFAKNMAKEMIHQMISLINANLKYPEEPDVPLHRFVRKKISLEKGRS